MNELANHLQQVIFQPCVFEGLTAIGTPWKDMDCHYTLAHAVHEHCPVSASHHATGGWNGYNMKYSQELVDHSLDLLV